MKSKTTIKLLSALLMVISAFQSIAQAPVISLQLYSFRNQFEKDVAGTMEKVHQLGIKDVELAGTYGKSVPDFLKLLQMYELNPIGMGVEFDLLENKAQQVVDDAKAFGVKYVVCFWIPHKDNDFGIAETNRAIAVFNKAGKILKDNGLDFCFHPHGYEFRPYNSGTLFDEIAQKTDPRYVNFEMDTYWVKHPGQDPVAVLKKYPNRFPLVHIKDRQKGTIGNQNGRSDVETNVVLGQGDVGIAAFVKEAPKAGVKYLIIEDESSKSETQVPQSIAYLKSLRK
jgi:sugar phosphate isomerase/epimerase